MELSAASLVFIKCILIKKCLCSILEDQFESNDFKWSKHDFQESTKIAIISRALI